MEAPPVLSELRHVTRKQHELAALRSLDLVDQMGLDGRHLGAGAVYARSVRHYLPLQSVS